MRHQSVKIITIFIISFFGTYGILKFANNQISLRQQERDRIETRIFQLDIKERFELFLDISLVIGQMASEYLSMNKQNSPTAYGELVKKVFKEKDYLIGLNMLDRNGQIVSTYPLEANKNAAGKTTQNLEELLDSFSRGEEYWFSPPFKLFQDGSGFAFYIPLISNGQLRGWIAPVIDSRIFFDHFKDLEFFNSYELIIEDIQTDGNYFSTAFIPENSKAQTLTSTIRGRNIRIISWRKDNKPPIIIPPLWLFLLSVLVSSLSAFAMKLILQKRQALLRLENISMLLRLTAKEALTKLLEIQSEYLEIGTTGYLRTSVVDKDVSSVTNLIEQIDLLQTIAESEHVEEETFDLLTEVEYQLKELSEIIISKSIKIDLNLDSLKNIKVTGNKWLISNTVIRNSLAHCVLISQPENDILIYSIQTDEEISINFHLKNTFDTHLLRTFKIERRILVAQNAMAILHGNIQLTQENNGMIIKIILSH